MAVVMASCRPVTVETDKHYQLRVDAIRAAITPRTRAIVTISPNNPSGAVYESRDLRAVNALCAERGLYHITDEVYEYFTYDPAIHVSAGAGPGTAAHTISIYSLSKAYGFASWRIGYMVVPESLAVAVNKIQDTMLICAPHVSQAAAIGALRAGRAYCDRHVATLAGVRARVLERLSAVGDLCEVPTAAGAFYCLLRIRTPMDAMTLAERLIREHRVATVPGTTFGLTDACYLRVSYGALAADTGDARLFRLLCDTIGRMCEDKGPRQAIEVARLAGMPLKIAAKMREEAELCYFRAEVEPLLGSDIEYVGELDEACKYQLLGNAIVLLNPIQWAEPFGLVMIEALACGTPVVATRAGSVPEIIQDGLTGFIRDDLAGLAQSLLRANDLDRKVCREVAETQFSTARMVADHVELYRQVLRGRQGGLHTDVN